MGQILHKQPENLPQGYQNFNFIDPSQLTQLGKADLRSTAVGLSLEVILNLERRTKTSPNQATIFSQLASKAAAVYPLDDDARGQWYRVAGVPQDAQGMLVNGWEVGEILGEGGMGKVHKARHQNSRAKGAIKFIKPEGVPDLEEAIENFRIEGRAMAARPHPNIATIHDLGNLNGVPYMVLGLIDGHELKDYLEHGPLDTDDALSYVKGIAKALSHAHDDARNNRRPIVHRDLKPSNIMIDKTTGPILLDFGVAKMRRKRAEENQEPRLIGTPGYMSPQQAGMQEVDHRADLWSLGAVFYEMLTGEKAIQGRGLTGLLYATTSIDEKGKGIALPRTINPSIPKPLETICMKLLEKDLEKRYKSATKLLEEIAKYEGEELSKAKRGKRIGFGLAAGVFALGLAFSGLQSYNSLQKIEEQQIKISQAIAKQDYSSARTLIDQLRVLDPDNLKTFVTRKEIDLLQFIHEENWGAAKQLFPSYKQEREAAGITGPIAGLELDRLEEIINGTTYLNLNVPEGATMVAKRIEYSEPINENKYGKVIGFDIEQEVTQGLNKLVAGDWIIRVEREGAAPLNHPIRLDHETLDQATAENPVYPRHDLSMVDASYVPDGFVVMNPVQVEVYNENGEPSSKTPNEVYALLSTELSLADYEAFLLADQSRDGRHVPSGQFWNSDGTLKRSVKHGGKELPIDPNWPVVGVSYDNVVAYLSWRSERDGKEYGLPSHILYNGATNGGFGWKYSNGDEIADHNSIGSMEFHERHHEGNIVVAPSDYNPLGFAHLTGNVTEHVDDPSQAVANRSRLTYLIGGSWASKARDSSTREGVTSFPRDQQRTAIGFRPKLKIPSEYLIPPQQ